MNAGSYLPDRPEFRVLSDQGTYQLHLSALEVLEKTGVEVHEEEALDVLRDAGCLVRNNRAFIPSRLVKQALRHYRNEQWFPRLMDRERHAGWEQSGSRALSETLHREAHRILDEHAPEPIADEKMQAIERIVEGLQG